MFFDADHQLHACEHCGDETAQQLAYIDRHGDIEQLCRRCYLEATEGSESPELARRDKRVAWGLAVIGGALLLWLSGCATRPHTVETRIVNGKPIEIHTDAPEFMEPPCPEPWAGCHVAGRIFFRSAYARPWMLKHELAHEDGMAHTPWEMYQFMRARCATVTAAGGGYKVGQVMCNRSDGEVVFTDASMKEVV